MRRLKKWLILLFLTILSIVVWFPLAFLLSGSFIGTQEVLQKLGPVLGDMRLRFLEPDSAVSDAASLCGIAA